MIPIPYDPDFDPPAGGSSETPSRTAFIFGIIAGIGLGAIAGLIYLV